MNIPDESPKPPTQLLVTCKQLPHRGSYSLQMVETPQAVHAPHLLIEDVTENADAALSFAKLLAEEEISPHHLADIIEDALPLK